MEMMDDDMLPYFYSGVVIKAHEEITEQHGWADLDIEERYSIVDLTKEHARRLLEKMLEKYDVEVDDDLLWDAFRYLYDEVNKGDFQPEDIIYWLIMRVLVQERADFERDALRQGTSVECLCTLMITEALRGLEYREIVDALEAVPEED